MRRNNQGGFGLVESILVVVLMVAVGFTIYQFAWKGPETARETVVTENDIKTMQTAVTAFALDSRGLFPTDDGKLPAGEEYKLIVWYASFTVSGKEVAFYPDFIQRLPKSWDQGIWRINSGGSVSVASE